MESFNDKDIFTEMFNVYSTVNDKINKNKLNAIEINDKIWKNYKFIPRKDVISTSVLRPVSTKDKYRTFDGSVRKGYGPVNANTMSSGLSDISVSSDIGFGNGSFGVTPYGESINSDKIAKFIGMYGNQDNDLMYSLLNSYEKIFNAFDKNTNVVLFGFQPSFREQLDLSIDISNVVKAINTFSGKTISLYVGESRNMESLDVIKAWYQDIGIAPDKINNMLFVEKNNSFDDECTDLPMMRTDANENCMSPLIKMKNIVLLGCIDPYFIGDAIRYLETHNKKYTVDIRYMYFLRSD